MCIYMYTVGSERAEPSKRASNSCGRKVTRLQICSLVTMPFFTRIAISPLAKNPLHEVEEDEEGGGGGRRGGEG